VETAPLFADSIVAVPFENVVRNEASFVVSLSRIPVPVGPSTFNLKPANDVADPIETFPDVVSDVPAFVKLTVFEVVFPASVTCCKVGTEAEGRVVP
jgi:hypothetical protein